MATRTGSAIRTPGTPRARARYVSHPAAATCPPGLDHRARARPRAPPPMPLPPGGAALRVGVPARTLRGRALGAAASHLPHEHSGPRRLACPASTSAPCGRRTAMRPSPAAGALGARTAPPVPLWTSAAEATKADTRHRATAEFRAPASPPPPSEAHPRGVPHPRSRAASKPPAAANTVGRPRGHPGPRAQDSGLRGHAPAMSTIRSRPHRCLGNRATGTGRAVNRRAGAP